MSLDRIDRKILDLLQKQGRIANAALAEKVGLSQSACSARMKRLESEGYISGYGAVLDLEKFGNPVIVFASITLEGQGKNHQAKFEAKVKALPEAVECYVISGAADYTVRFVCRNIAAYHTLTEALLADPSLGIKNIASRFIMRTLKPFAGVDLDTLAEK